MTIRLHDLEPADGSNKRGKRKARGIGGKGGKTAGRGTKGQRARNTVARGFEGGQTPLKMRVPKLKGFTNPFRVEYTAVNLDTIKVVTCYADMNDDGFLNINDFVAFQTTFAIGDDDADATQGCVLDINDFIAFQTKFAIGCP